MTAAGQKLSLPALISLVIGSMIGAGIFALPAAFSRVSGAAGAMIAWAIAGIGMLMLAFVFQTLALRKPELDAGIYSYAKEGFGPYAGFISAFGYWIGACLADVACLVLIKATLGKFFPVFGDGTTVTAIVSASLLLWGVHFLVLRGIKQAATINTIATVAKIIPLGLFIVIATLAFQRDLFELNFRGGPDHGLGSVGQQVRNTMLVTVFVFVGVEGASVYSRYAKRREDVGLATVLGFLGVLSLMVLVTMLSYGVLPRAQIGALPDPSLAGVFSSIVGPWGAVFISVGLIVSVLGNYLSWALLSAEVMYSAAKNESMPRFLARENERKVPAAALWMTNAVIQVFLLVSYFAEYAFLLALKMTGAMILLPYLLVAAYGLKLAHTGETYAAQPAERRLDWIRGAVATLYTAAMLSTGPKYVLLSTLIYVLGTWLFFQAHREQGRVVFSGAERYGFAVLLAGCVAAVWALGTGAMRL